jgi:hypothetical protein
MNNQALRFVAVAMEGVIPINFLARTDPQPRFRYGHVKSWGSA